MAGYRIQVAIFPPFQGAVSARWLRRVAEKALEIGAPADGLGLGVVLAGDSTVRELNRAYRGLDETTDVLAFAFDHAGQYEGEGEPPAVVTQGEFIVGPEHGRFLGEVIVSYPQCCRQAESQQHSVRNELALLVAHGVLHLLGYDHVAPQDERVMKEHEAAVLAALGRPVPPLPPVAHTRLTRAVKP